MYEQHIKLERRIDISNPAQKMKLIADGQIGERAEELKLRCSEWVTFIETIAETGKYCIYTHATGAPTWDIALMPFLAEQGFKIRHISGDPRDQRGRSYHIISWN